VLSAHGRGDRLRCSRQVYARQTTLARKALVDAEKIDMNTIYVNFYGILSLEDASNRIEKAYRESLQGRVRSWAIGAIRTLKPTLTVPKTGLQIAPEMDQEAARRLYSLLATGRPAP